jgi:hypothetical protein
MALGGRVDTNEVSEIHAAKRPTQLPYMQYPPWALQANSQRVYWAASSIPLILPEICGDFL